MKPKLNKKGEALQMIGALATGIAVLAIMLIIAFLIINEGKTETKEACTSLTATNETFTFNNGTYVALSHSTGVLAITCNALINCSNGELLQNISSYTCTIDNGILAIENMANKTNGSKTGITACVNYTYTDPCAAYNGTQQLENATSEVPGWVPIIVICFLGVILVGIVKPFTDK